MARDAAASGESITPFHRAYNRTRRTQTPALYFERGKWMVTASGYTDQTLVDRAVEHMHKLNRVARTT
jgi:hypothetical protein